MNYTDLHEMYRYVYKQDTSAAVDIIKEGIPYVSVEAGIDLRIALATYYKDKRDNENAVLIYTEARDEAEKLGNTNLVDELNAEIRALK